METFLLDNSRSNFIAKKLILRRSCGMRHTLFEQATVYLSDLYHYFMPGVHEIVINTSKITITRFLLKNQMLILAPK